MGDSTDTPNYYPILDEWEKIGRIYRGRKSKELWRHAMFNFNISKHAAPGESALDTLHRIPLETKAEWQRYKTPSEYDHSWRRTEAAPDVDDMHEAWDFVVMEACHWMADVHLYVARRHRPRRDWQIAKSPEHSTVWDPATMTVWDTAFLLVGISPEQALRLAGALDG